ncbi:MAG: Tim44 domain-containing protein [Gammaproteobacteria bacterium]|nr:Tim44 domain-containing protein [Gammaproteobacteria bacterium]
MKIKTGIIFSVMLSLFLVFAGLDDAEARRFGGGGNFGGRSSYSSPYQRSVQPSRQYNQQQQQQQANRQNPAANPAMRNRGLMGMLGALAVGGLLGSMLTGGAFHGFNFLDILVLGGIAYMLFKMFAARSQNTQRPAYDRTYHGGSHNDSQPYGGQNPQNSPAGFNTDLLFDKNKPVKSGVEQDAPYQDAEFDAAVIPKGFDEQNFLNGAKIAYKTLQKAWDTRDLAEIRGLTTDKVFSEIQDQLNAATEENHTDVLKIDAELLEVREIGNEIEAVVLFDTILREDRNAQANQVREVWHFVKPNNPQQTKWLLDGIQQLAD